MKMNTIGKDERSMLKIVDFFNNSTKSDMEMEATCYWILSLLGGVSIGGIWLVSVFTQ
jgi:hypothetical protein